MKPELVTGAVVAATYMVAGVLPAWGGRWRPFLLALVPAAVAVWTFGLDSWPNGIAVVFTWITAAVGFSAQDNVQHAGGWIGVQAAVTAALIGLTVVGEPSGPRVPAEAAALAVLVAGLVVTVEWGGAWVGRAIRRFADAMYTAKKAPDGVITAPGLPSGFPDGGRMIGRLERLLIYLFVLANAPTAIGFLVTAKSILRFGEVKDAEHQKEAEYIIIGTLMSFGFALVTSYLTRLALLALLPEGTLTLLQLGE